MKLDFFGDIVRVNKTLTMRGDLYPSDTESEPPACPDCHGSGLIFVSVSAWGDRVSEICKCPSGDADRRYIDREEQRLRDEERRRDARRTDL